MLVCDTLLRMLLGESNVYTIGYIGQHKVVSTKLPAVGRQMAAQISSGNTTTRLLGTCFLCRFSHVNVGQDRSQKFISGGVFPLPPLPSLFPLLFLLSLLLFLSLRHEIQLEL